MYRVVIDTRVGGFLKLGGGVPGFDEFRQSAWHGVVAQWILVAHRSNRPVGVFTLSSADMRNGHAFVAVYADPFYIGTGLGIEGATVAIDYVFRMWPFRMLYADVSRPAFEQFKSVLDRGFEIEGIRREHLWMDGGFHDLLMLRISRESWEREGRPLADRLHRGYHRRTSS